MIRRSPCEVYLKYLIVHPDGYANESIRKLVHMQQLDFLGIPYLERLRAVCVPPTPFFPEDRLHIRSNRFLRKERLETIFHPDDAMRAAVAILDNTRAKELTENMLIGQAHPAWVCTALRRQGLDVQVEAITRFKHYYFNVDLVDSVEMKALMSLRSASESSTDPDETRIASAQNTLSKGDYRRVLAQTSNPISMNIMNTLRMGLLPSSVDVARLAEATRTAALGGGLDMALRGLPTQGRDFALMAKMMTEILESVGDPSNDLQEGLARLLVDTEEVDIPNIKQLSQGEYTLDVQPMDATAEVDAGEP